MTGDDPFDRAACGLILADSDGVIERVNSTLLEWTGFTAEALLGEKFTDLLVPGSQIFYETRHLPVLRLAGELREVALSMNRADGVELPVLLNSRLDDGVMSLAIFDATARQNSAGPCTAIPSASRGPTGQTFPAVTSPATAGAERASRVLATSASASAPSVEAAPNALDAVCSTRTRASDASASRRAASRSRS